MAKKETIEDIIASFPKLGPGATSEEARENAQKFWTARKEKQREESEQELEKDLAAERQHVRDLLHADLKIGVEPLYYPESRNKEGEPSLELWRRGYLTLKARDDRRIFWFKTSLALVGFCALLWGLQQLGFL